MRDLGDPLLRSRLPVHAEAVGLDGNWYWGNRTYRLMANVAASNVAGDAEAMTLLQRSSARYFSYNFV